MAEEAALGEGEEDVVLSEARRSGGDGGGEGGGEVGGDGADGMWEVGGGGGKERELERVVRKEARRERKRGRETEVEEREVERKEAAVARAGSAGERDQSEGGIWVGSAEEVGGGGAAPGVRTMGFAATAAAAAAEGLVMAARSVMAPAREEKVEGLGFWRR